MALYSRDRARRSLLDTVSFRLLSQASTVLGYIVLVRGMSEQSFGVYSLLYSFVPILATVGSLGIDQTIRRFQPEYLASGRPEASAWLIRVAQLARLASNGLLIAIVLAAWSWIGPWFKLTEHRADFALFAALLVLYFQVNILQFALSAHMLHRFSIGSIAMISVVKLLAYLAISYYGTLTLERAILTDAAAFGLAFCFLSVVYWTRVRGGAPKIPFRLPEEDRARLRRYAAYNHFNDTASPLVYAETDRFFIAAMLNPIAVGAYAFYSRLNEMAYSLVPVGLLDSLIQPLFFSVAKGEAADKIPRYFTLLLNLALAYQLPLIAFTACFHAEIVAVIFGGKFAEYSALLPLIMLFATVTNVFAVPITLVAQYDERARLILVSELFGLYQVGAMLVLVPWIGIFGAAAATGSFHLLRNLFVWYFVRDKARWTSWRSTLTSGAVIWGIALLICVGFRELAAAPSIVDLAFGVVVCGVGGLIYLRSPGISASDRALVGNVMRGSEAQYLRWLGILRQAA